MTRFIQRKYYDFLKGELALWQSQSLLTPEQAHTVLELYGVRQRNFSHVLLTGGALLMGLGALCAIAANWWEIPRELRAAIIIAVYLLCMAAAALCSRTLPRTSKAVHLLASFVFGGGIFLTAQMYHQAGHWSTAFGFWAAGVLPGAFLLRDRAQVFLYQALTALFMLGSDLRAWNSSLGALWTQRDALIGLAVAASWLVSAHIRSATALHGSVLLSLGFAFSRLLRHFDIVTTLLFFWAVGGVCIALFRTDSRRDWQAAFAFWGGLLAGAIGLLLSIPEAWEEFAYLSALESVASSGLTHAFSGVRHFAAALAASLTALLMLFRLWRGSRMAAVFLVLIALRYFVDHFFGFMSKAAAFGLLGVLCLALGLWWERRTKTAQRRKEHDHD